MAPWQVLCGHSCCYQKPSQRGCRPGRLQASSVMGEAATHPPPADLFPNTPTPIIAFLYPIPLPTSPPHLSPSLSFCCFRALRRVPSQLTFTCTPQWKGSIHFRFHFHLNLPLLRLENQSPQNLREEENVCFSYTLSAPSPSPGVQS